MTWRRVVALSALASWAITLIGGAIWSSRRAREIVLLVVSLILAGFIFAIRLDVERVQGEAGRHEVVFNAEGLSSGTYLYRLETPQGSFVKTMLVLK